MNKFCKTTSCSPECFSFPSFNLKSNIPFFNNHPSITYCWILSKVHNPLVHIERVLEEKNYCSAMFRDGCGTFYRVWHQDSIHKMAKLLSANYWQLPISHLLEQTFREVYEEALLSSELVSWGVLQGSGLEPLLYLKYTTGIPTTENVCRRYSNNGHWCNSRKSNWNTTGCT